jgi:hypothetical protein
MVPRKCRRDAHPLQLERFTSGFTLAGLNRSLERISGTDRSIVLTADDFDRARAARARICFAALATLPLTNQ